MLGAPPQRAELIVNRNDAGHVEPLAAEQPDQPAGERQDDRVGDQVAGQDPGGLAPADRQAAGDVRQGDVGDRGVEHLHERRQRDRQGDDPVVDRGLDPGTASRCRCPDAAFMASRPPLVRRGCSAASPPGRRRRRGA